MRELVDNASRGKRGHLRAERFLPLLYPRVDSYLVQSLFAMPSVVRGVCVEIEVLYLLHLPDRSFQATAPARNLQSTAAPGQRSIFWIFCLGGGDGAHCDKAVGR